MRKELREALQRLSGFISWSGGPFSGTLAYLDPVRHEDLVAFLRLHNGVIAFNGGLRCFGLTSGPLPDIASWNDIAGWRGSYRMLADGLEFFAEDALGNQFAYEGERVVRFLAETGERELMGDSFAGWIGRFLEDPEAQLSLWLLRDWTSKGGVLDPGDHLCPKIPFVAGGSCDASDLYTLDRNKSMSFKGDFAWQIRNVPEGGKVRLKVVD